MDTIEDNFTGTGGVLFPPHIFRLFIRTQPDKLAVPQVIVTRPLDELELRDKLRL